MGRVVEANPGAEGVTLFFSTIGGLGPLLSLVLVEKLSGKEEVVKDIFSRIRIRNTNICWVLTAALIYPIITLLSQLLYALIGLNDQVELIKPGVDDLGLFVIPVMAIHFVASLLTSPLFEEPGWRGFALINLQDQYGRYIGSLIVGVLWWIWHQPMNIPFGIMPSVYSFAKTLTSSFFIDSLFNLSSRNLFIAMLAHQSYGTTFTFLNQGTNNMFQLVCMILVVVGLRIREWNVPNDKSAHKKLPPSTRSIQISNTASMNGRRSGPSRRSSH
jgi:membrane protease YdiL (CAAX protease family)